ncbi:iron ABC transporter permease [Candidatus Pelagibacter bacterium]|jgi:iron(III) transport system permease protein|nr:iron ABC transporter permease [Candidatus Pelagibacter bacterium]|tara:strand:- start:609 stop:2288 length:1680 start_codon:yes stop_codon:yes gene_type:complete
MFKNLFLKSTALFIGLFLLIFLAVPIFQVFYVSFLDQNGHFTLLNFYDFFQNALFIESFYNSFYVASMSVVLASVFALPLAYFTSRFNFRGSVIIQSLGFIPLIMPPFVGAVAMKLLFGSNGSINLILNDWFGFKIPFMEGLNGVIFVESIHYFPFILINLITSLNNIDRTMEESAQSLGSKGFGLFRKIVLPLSMPGYVAGASLVFLKVFDDLGTPLLLDVNNMLAPQAYLRISSIGINDPMGYVIGVILVLTSIAAVYVAKLALGGKDYSMLQKGGGGMIKRDFLPYQKYLAYFVVFFILFLVLSPHIALTLLSFGTIWSFSVLPDAFTVQHYKAVFENSVFIKNTMLYCSIAAFIDVVLAFFISYIVLRTKIIGRQLLDYIAMSALAIPGLVLGIGYLRTFYSINLPWDNTPLASWWFMIVIILAVRRLPYALRACNAVLMQISKYLEESAESLGAQKISIFRKILIPLMTGGLLAGFITSFSTATVELSATIMLVSTESEAPLAYAIYSYMQTAAGRGPGAAFGLIGVLIVAVGTYLSQLIIEKKYKQRGMEAKV